VIGLGGSGLAAVAGLLERGLSVVGVDAGRVAAGAAGRNGGFLLGGPALFLHDAIKRWGADAAVGLYRETLAELDRLETVLGPDVVRRVGSIDQRSNSRGGNTPAQVSKICSTSAPAASCPVR